VTEKHAVAAARLDMLMMKRGLVRSRAQAAELIARGSVTAGGRPATKAGLRVPDDVEIQLLEMAPAWVSRAGEKLRGAIDTFRLARAFQGARVLDVGASTGGFSEVALKHGAAHVFAVDVGHDQLHVSLRHDARVSNLQKLDARRLMLMHVEGRAVDILVSDLSFISLHKALGPALRLVHDNGLALLLVKPQFEVGPDRVGKGGIVQEPQAHADAVSGVCQWLETQCWKTIAVARSTLPGKEGNQEFVVFARPSTLIDEVKVDVS